MGDKQDKQHGSKERERGSHKSALKSRMVLTVLTSTASTGNQIDLLGNGPLR